MPKSIQAKVLRVLQDGMVRRVGSETTDAVVDVRFIAATTRDPEAAIASGLVHPPLARQRARAADPHRAPRGGGGAGDADPAAAPPSPDRLGERPRGAARGGGGRSPSGAHGTSPARDRDDAAAAARATAADRSAV